MHRSRIDFWKTLPFDLTGSKENQNRYDVLQKIKTFPHSRRRDEMHFDFSCQRDQVSTPRSMSIPTLFKELNEQWNYQIAVAAIEIQALNGDDVIGREIDRSVDGGAGAMLEVFRSGQSMSAPRRGRADLFRSAVFEKTNSLRSKTSARGLYGTDISGQETLLAKNKQHLNIIRRQINDCRSRTAYEEMKQVYYDEYCRRFPMVTCKKLVLLSSDKLKSRGVNEPSITKLKLELVKHTRARHETQFQAQAQAREISESLELGSAQLDSTKISKKNH
ncbi:hypothetical protein LXL04_026260 [Taraxacum kok-saghyz]